MSDITRRERGLLFLTISLALLLLAYTVIIRPNIRKIGRLRIKVANSAQTLERMRTTVKRKNGVDKAYKEIRDGITSSKDSAEEIMDMLLDVEEAAKKSGVEILENGYQSDEALEYFSRHTLAFRGRGEMKSLTTMLYALQDPELLLRIPQVDFVIKNYKIEMDIEITRIVCAPENDDAKQ
jgi:Tfp pilus assembly protein PilO